MQIRGDCVGELAAGQITFARDGVFGAPQRDDVKIEALFDGPSIYLRLTGPTLETSGAASSPTHRARWLHGFLKAYDS